MIFLWQRKVKAVAAEQTSVGRNLRSISEQEASNLTVQTKRWPPWGYLSKKERDERRWRESLIDPLSALQPRESVPVAIASIISLRFSTTVQIPLVNAILVSPRVTSSSSDFSKTSQHFHPARPSTWNFHPLQSRKIIYRVFTVRT